MSEDWTLTVANGDGKRSHYPLWELATSQMCQRLSIPVDYYRRLPGEMKAMVANYDLQRLNGNAYLLRGKGEWIPALLSAEYVPYNNAQIAETVQGLLKEAPVMVKAFVLEETNVFLKIVSEEIVDVDSGLKAGIMIGNSEVGMGSVSVEPFVFRKACTNDLVVTQERIFRHAHIHLTVYELNRRMAEAISNAFEVASSLLDAFLKTREEPVPDPVETIRKLALGRKLSQKFTDEVVSSFQAEPEPNRFGVINAFTSAAQKLAPLQRIEVERFAGSLLEKDCSSFQTSKV
ncbi:MAG: hypothetical protein L0387_22385 [Acidobacteria bacterium]|nr:hypothetical protein [Acidobacteriota bacterium]MCI0624357.1 hypothetical protein [Acidobacteriota bacterium]MCI0723319.1 hypothetical protein [Acidobacteriota bacterium]